MSNKRLRVVDEFVSVTGADPETAKHLLDACSDDLERAIEMYLDNKSETTESPAAPPNDPSVRAPIPQTSGVLIDDPHYAVTTSRERWSSRRRPRSVFDGFRDFKAETSLQEGLVSNHSGMNSGTKRLEDLFRPPLELMHRGTFETARESGRATGKWLMVNLQNVREFSCQVLNRDVWSKKTLQDLIGKHFVFWQVYSGSTEGERFTTFYPVNGWPHVSILDPRTGERLAVWKDVNANTFETKVAEFLADHGALIQEEEESNGPPSKRSKTEDCSLIDKSEDSQLAAAIAASLAESKHTPRVQVSDYDDEISDCSGFDVSEADDIVIDDSDSKDSIATHSKLSETDRKLVDQTKVDQNFFKAENNDDSILQNGNTHTDEPGEKLYKKIKSKLKIGSVPNGKDMSRLTEDKFSNAKSNTFAIDPKDICRIMIRYPDGAREEIQMDVNLTVQAVLSELIVKGYPREDYDLLTHFPRKNVYSQGLDKTLKEAGLYPRSAVFVEEIER